MFVMARINQSMRDLDACISLREAFKVEGQRRTQMAGTVLLTNVGIAANIRGQVLEASEKRIKPRKEILAWPKLRYVSSIGTYVDVRTGAEVKRAKAVYMVGDTIYYLPQED